MKDFFYNDASWYEKQESIKTVIVTKGVTSIGVYAFYRCMNLKSIVIPDSVTSIGERAFYKCKSPRSINIPDSVTSIGEMAFGNWASTQTINIRGRVKALNGWDACWNKNCEAKIVWGC